MSELIIVTGVICLVANDVKGDIATFLLYICRAALERNVDKKFMTPMYLESDICIPGDWTLATAYDAKSGPIWLDKGMAFSSVKELLEGIYSDVKKGTRYVVWLGFRMSEEETLPLRELSAPIIGSTSPIKSTPAKPRPALKKKNLKRNLGRL
jgi:hypothetical protein